MIEKPKGIKTIEILAQTRYTIVSAYEFEDVKSEKIIQELLRPSTIYFIIQRPLIYFDDVRINNDGSLSFEITDDSSNEPLKCRFDPSENKFCGEEEEMLVDIQFYKKNKDKEQPFFDVASISLFELNGKLLVSFSPQAFIYEYLLNTMNADIQGNINNYIDYHVHYIGKAFSQDVWDRLTGHHKMQRILTIEDSLNTKSLKAPFEISLLMLNIVGFREAHMYPFRGVGLSQDIKPILHDLGSDDAFEQYFFIELEADAEELTTEVEAFLINKFKPKYNKILFNNYPYIKGGTRSAGYTESLLVIDEFPAILRTDKHIWDAILSKEVINEFNVS